MRLFDRPGDYQDFLYLWADAQRHVRVPCFAFCLMPNHFHFVVRPAADGDLSRFMYRLSMKHALRWHKAHGTGGTGPIYQGRFKALPVHTDHHFLVLCRYVERNPVRAGLVHACEEWQWSSVVQRSAKSPLIELAEWPVERPAHWLELLAAEHVSETESVRKAIARSAPFGPMGWRDRIASRLEMTGNLAAIGRPRKPNTGVLF